MNALVVMAYGTPRHADEIEAYYTDIRRGRPPTAEQLADLVRRYEAIGGLSPLAERTEAQRAAIAAELGDEWEVATGLRHAAPSIEAAVADLAGRGAERVTGLVLAPHFSTVSVAAYHARAQGAAEAVGVTYTGIESWAADAAYVGFLATAVTRSLEELPEGTRVLFTAHSLPQRVIADGDPYPTEVGTTAASVADEAGLADGAWSVGWQSAGRTQDPWLGPDVLEEIDRLADEGAPGLLVCPCGFVSDHLEVLYDLDIEAAGRAAARRLAFARTAVVNDDPAVMRSLAALVAATTDRPPAGAAP